VHELAIAQDVVAVVAERTQGRTVRSVQVRIGRLSGVMADAFAFSFEVAAAGTALEGAALQVEEPPGVLRCHECAKETEVADWLLLCPCGSVDVEVVSGQELRIVSVELEREVTCA
jgi:hydrogenase nickel incorporation protein HypA/HybF